ncbi:MAG TPA: ParB/RepB/Spo0J family partition protein [Sulfurovum sp.]|jgi:ParB family chromosome partitioning protein|nr:MAG: chromosome partitioning protein ParB [Sulfurovum sp. 35-42-20]OYY56091.1 MAG: chromosome partitioning protein ParB [Sulfurovum sp. 28-43-6]OYZ24161.1 MAG: chromosome partitioning protein ParB [Sulfurovum sp. 16-42-52]OYZ47920.1 MAG: chromosome partitioning protein ParB [Sulfurovum sp. 24-42-9]OZA43983.1 MAG: chromosome partitioning protein ParB [Sulfurovum sp. 17-42-90]HQS73486.1 ParB/RepB/Spo0J family partition protein [Sulfurovum sp.]
MALGRGLGEILSEVEEAYEKDLSDINSFELEARGARVEELSVGSITANPFQPRKHFDEQALKELSQSISEHGLLQPIVVIETENGYLLIAGERRLRAHKLAGLSHIKAIIADVEMDEARLRELALIENIQRENLNAIELANSYAELIEVHNITHDELSSIVHKSRSQITNTMRLLSLSAYAQEQLVEGKISQGHAKILVGLDEKKQKIIIDSIMGQKLSVRDTEQMVKNHKSTILEPLPKAAGIHLMEKYSKIMENSLPFTYKLKQKSIEISFDSEKEVEAFIAYFGTKN